jgi:hypothetical protein
MNTDRFHVRGLWGPRGESLEDCGRRIRSFLDRIEPIHPALATWYEQAGSRRAALNRPIGRDIEAISRLVKKGLISPRETYPGVLIGAWNGDDLTLAVRCGETSPILGNVINVTLPSIKSGGPDGLERELAEKALSAAVDEFEPDWAVVASERLRDEFATDNRGRHGGFITFLNGADQVFQLPPGVSLQTVPLGVVLRLDNPTFIPSDPAQHRVIEHVTHLVSQLQGDRGRVQRH